MQPSLRLAMSKSTPSPQGAQVDEEVVGLDEDQTLTLLASELSLVEFSRSSDEPRPSAEVLLAKVLSTKPLRKTTFVAVLSKAWHSRGKW